MKKALMDFTGGVADIVEPGEEYPLFLGRGCSQMWVNAPDDISKTYTLEWSCSTDDIDWVKCTEAYAEPATTSRVANGEDGQQLDLIVNDLEAGRALNADDALWFNHIKTVKEFTTRHSDVEEPLDPTMTEEEIAEFMGDGVEPSTNRPMKVSSQELPCWERYSNWGRTYEELPE